jgi:hypothetical protein
LEGAYFVTTYLECSSHFPSFTEVDHIPEACFNLSKLKSFNILSQALVALSHNESQEDLKLEIKSSTFGYTT